MQKGIKRKQYGGWTPKLFNEKKVIVYEYVKREHQKEFQEFVTEHAKKYR